MTSAWQKKYRWVRTWPDDRGQDDKPPEDYSAYDGGQYAGRIRLDLESLKHGQWMWSGAYPKGWRNSPIMPNRGYAPSPAEAAKLVEDYWDAMKKKNGLTDE
jgi:hypothetical protein